MKKVSAKPDLHKRARSQLKQAPQVLPLAKGKSPKAISWGSDDENEQVEANDTVPEAER